MLNLQLTSTDLDWQHEMTHAVCVRCERENTNADSVFSIDTEDSDGVLKMAQHFKEVHDIDIDSFKKIHSGEELRQHVKY